MFKNLSTKFLAAVLCLLSVSPLINAQSEFGIVNSGDLITRGVALHDEQKYDDALKLYNQVPENDTNYTLATVEKAFTYYAKKDYETAIKMCEEALSAGTEYDNSLYITLGSAYDDAGKPEKAIEVYDRGIKAFPKSHRILFNKAVTLEKQEKYAEAIETYKQVLKISPYHASTHIRLGSLAEKEGDLTRAMLCYDMFLLLEPASERALSVLQTLNSMVNKKYDNSGAKGVKFAENGEDFSEIENLIRKQLALNKNYKLETKADFPVVRQNQALLSYLATHKGTKGYWESFYVPIFAQIYKEGRFEAFSYFLLSSSDNDKIKSLVAKNKGDISKFNDWKAEAFRNLNTKRKVDIDGKPTDVVQVFYNSGNLYGFGPFFIASDKTEKKIGKWEFYHPNGRVMSTGSYDSQGKQTSDWKFYYENGLPKKETKVTNGEEDGAYKVYRENGNLQEAGTYVNGKLEKDIKVYTWYGGLSELHQFKNGQHDGKYEEYYPNGQLRFSSTYVGNKLNGAYKSFYADGKLNVEGTMKDNMKEGLFTAYFRNGKVQVKKNYILDKENGAFVKYYANGQIKQEGNFKNEKTVGTWKSYHPNGQLDEVDNYNDAGNEEGIQQYFDMDGKVYYESECKNGRVLQFKCIDKTGKVVVETKLKGKQEIKSFYSDGSLRWIGNLENGKRNGLWKEYYRNGQLSGEYTYNDGDLDGPAKVYFYNGKVYKQYTYKKGNLQGKYQEYFRNGQLYKAMWYENGLGQGDVTFYNHKGGKERFYTLYNDEIIGKCYNYDVDGKLSITELYDKGNFKGMLFYDTTGKEIKNVPVDKDKIVAEYPSITGEILMKRTFLSGSKEGASNSYFLDNKPEAEGIYLNDKREGVWKWFNPDNTPSSTRTYADGEMNGVGENFDLFGKLKSHYDYVDDNIYGTGLVYYYNGNKKEEVPYWEDSEHGGNKYYGFNGEHVMTLIYEHGTVKKVVYVNGKNGPDTVAAPLNGTIEAKYANGKTAFIMDYKNGYQHGRYQEFFEDGTPCRSATYADDLLEGERKTWYRNGKLRSVENYSFNDDDGLTVLYNENGTKKAELSYKNDVLHGPVKYYDANGKLIAHYIFYNRDMVKKVL
jgi:antitoxin component YwqK of YwqJK toxin-antitoxin module/Tfp pilus assembly protein PilF